MLPKRAPSAAMRSHAALPRFELLPSPIVAVFGSVMDELSPETV
jgi:hypothetical protein